MARAKFACGFVGCFLGRFEVAVAPGTGGFLIGPDGGEFLGVGISTSQIGVKGKGHRPARAARWVD